MQKSIKIEGARVNNLKDVSLEIPINKITCFIGPSGSGKTSLAFHTLYAESKRRFLNSFPSYLKFFSDRPAPVDVDNIFPVLPVFGLPQINPVIGTRSNIADTMHLTELFQSYFYHYAQEMCPQHGEALSVEPFTSFISNSLDMDEEVYHVFITKDDFLENFSKAPLPTRSIKSKRSKKVQDFNKDDEFWELFRFKPSKLGNLNKKAEGHLSKQDKLFFFGVKAKKLIELKYDGHTKKCPVMGCGTKEVRNLTVSHFSPYNALGACDTCSGFGETLDYDLDKLVDKRRSVKDGGVVLLKYKRFSGQHEKLISELKKSKVSVTKPIAELGNEFWEILYKGSGQYQGFTKYFNYLERKKYKMNVRIFIRNIQKSSKCTDCNGVRLKRFSRQFFLDKSLKLAIPKMMTLSIRECLELVKDHQKDLFIVSKEAKKAYEKIVTILETALNIGLGHLQLDRKSKTISAGEYQRLLLLKYLSYEGTNSLFVFDEPSLGLAESEMKALHIGLKKLIKQNNTIIIIEHNDYLIKKSDYLVKVGPRAGHLGGEIIYSGAMKDFKFPRNKAKLVSPAISSSKKIQVYNPEIYDKKFKDFKLLVGGINLVTGSSGTGKTSCLINILANELYYNVYGEYLNINKGTVRKISGPTDFSDVIIVDANLNRYTSRSTVGSMTELFSVVRKHYIKTPSAKVLGLKDGHLSYNSALGSCPKCEGKGALTIEMQFLDDIKLECEDCNGKKLKSIYADITDGKRTVHEAYTSPLADVVADIKLTPKFQRIFEYLKILNLDYLSLDRQINSLSGGEIQRIYLLNKIQKNLENSIIFFENISFGLSDKELIDLCGLLKNLILKNNTIVLLDQNPRFREIANHIIEFK